MFCAVSLSLNIYGSHCSPGRGPPLSDLVVSAVGKSLV